MRQWTWGACLFSLMILVFSDKCPEVKLLSHMIVLFSIFSGNYIPIFHSGYTVSHFPQWCTRVPFFPTSLPTFLVSCLFNNSHSNKCEVRKIFLKKKVEHNPTNIFFFACFIAVFCFFYKLQRGMGNCTMILDLSLCPGGLSIFTLCFMRICY